MCSDKVHRAESVITSSCKRGLPPFRSNSPGFITDYTLRSCPRRPHCPRRIVLRSVCRLQALSLALTLHAAGSCWLPMASRMTASGYHCFSFAALFMSRIRTPALLVIFLCRSGLSSARQLEPWNLSYRRTSTYS